MQSTNVLDDDDEEEEKEEGDDDERANPTTDIKPMFLLKWFCFSLLHEAFEVQL